MNQLETAHLMTRLKRIAECLTADPTPEEVREYGIELGGLARIAPDLKYLEQLAKECPALFMGQQTTCGDGDGAVPVSARKLKNYDRKGDRYTGPDGAPIAPPEDDEEEIADAVQGAERVWSNPFLARNGDTPK